MRVISGTAKGMNLKTIEGLATRPTTDRVKEALFNIINPGIYKASVLDLFSGSGSLAIEALSRGAASADIVELSPVAVACINENLTKTRLAVNASVHTTDVFAYLKNCRCRYDFIFMDPPYHSDLIVQAISLISSRNLLKEGGIIVCECDHDEVIPKTISDINLYDTRKYGRVLLNFLKKM